MWCDWTLKVYRSRPVKMFHTFTAYYTSESVQWLRMSKARRHHMNTQKHVTLKTVFVSSLLIAVYGVNDVSTNSKNVIIKTIKVTVSKNIKEKIYSATPIITEYVVIHTNFRNVYRLIYTNYMTTYGQHHEHLFLVLLMI